MRISLPWLGIIAALTGGCDAGGGMGSPDLAMRPPVICRTPPAPGALWFTEVTADVGLAPTASFVPIGSSVHAGDLDGDGYADFIATMTPVDMRDTPAVRNRFVFMNRPAPGDPTGQRRVFVDETEASQLLATRDGMGGYTLGVVNLGDLDNDGDLDVAAGTGSPTGAPNTDPGAIFINDGHGHFTLGPPGDVEMDVTGFSSQAGVLVDFDRDGRLDFLAGTFQFPPPNYLPPLFFHNQGGGAFKEVAESLGINVRFGDFASNTQLPPMYGMTACDLDSDGDPDILMASYGREPSMYYENDGTGHFSERGIPLGIAYDDRMDYSDDQSYRCYCQNHPGKCVPSPPAPAPNICTGFGGTDGRGWVPGTSDQPWNLGGNNYTFVCDDIDDDGDMDLLVTTIRHGDVGSASDPTELLINVTPPGMPLMKLTRPGNVATGLERKEIGMGWNEGGLTAAFADFDLDGRKDIFLAQSAYPTNHGYLWRQKADGTFEDITATSGGGMKQPRGLAIFDYDHDGDLDLVMATSTERAVEPTAALRVFRNDIGQGQNFIQIQLEGKGEGHSNRSAIGARVKVTAGGRTQQLELNGGFGFTVTQNDLVLTFGLGAVCAVDQVEVRWPDAAGTVSTFTDVLANYRVKVTEGETSVQYLFGAN